MLTLKPITLERQSQLLRKLLSSKDVLTWIDLTLMGGQSLQFVVVQLYNLQLIEKWNFNEQLIDDYDYYEPTIFYLRGCLFAP